MNLAVARPAVADALARFTDVVSSVDPAMRLPDSDWTVADVAAHLLIVARALEGYLAGEHEPVLDVDDVPASNARTLAERTERDVASLTAQLADATDGFLRNSKDATEADPTSWHGMDATVGTVYGIYLGELLLHGRDVARAAGRPWPISRADATMIFEGGAAVAHGFLDREKVRGLRAIYEVRLRGGPRLTFAFADGALAVTPGPAIRADCRISADPLAVVLVVYGRTSQWAQIARGKLMSFGRKPWQASRFAGLFKGF
ncbi:MAG TPA: maleylpyruvate isomerase family mycothiol-dependent enzyme [Acidimicrobiia bacterium]|nr:maleylpyruvate isomerase family mycothiol-dependent enzyme [Acidimicrobiia bacterium]